MYEHDSHMERSHLTWLYMSGLFGVEHTDSMMEWSKEDSLCFHLIAVLDGRLQTTE